MASRAAAMAEARDGKALEAPAAPPVAEATPPLAALPAATPAAAPQGRKKPERSN